MWPRVNMVGSIKILMQFICVLNLVTLFISAKSSNNLSKLERKANLPATQSQSVVITNESFKFITSKGTWLIKHYAPWCPHCKKLAPHWVKLSEEYASYKEKYDFNLGEVNCDIEADVCSKNNIQGYPTILLFHGGSLVEEYTGSVKNGKELSKYIVEKAKVYDPIANDSKEKVKTANETPSESEGSETSSSSTSESAAATENLNWVEKMKQIQDDSAKVKEEVKKLSEKEKKELSFPITDSTFKFQIAEGIHFVKFFAPWCPHCQLLEPIWYSISNDAKVQALKKSSRFSMAQVNCDEYGDFCQSEKVQYYPFLKMYKDGKHVATYPNLKSRERKEIFDYILQVVPKVAKSEKLDKKLGGIDLKEKNKLEENPNGHKPKAEHDHEHEHNHGESQENTESEVVDEKEIPTVELPEDEKLLEEIAEKSKTIKPVLEDAIDLKEHVRFSDRSQRLTESNFTASVINGIWFIRHQPISDKPRPFDYLWFHLSSEFSQFHKRYGVRFATIDCHTSKELCEKHKATTYPYIQIYDNGALVDTYTNHPTYELLRKYVRDYSFNLATTKHPPTFKFSNQRTANPDGKSMLLNGADFTMLTNEGPWFVFFKTKKCVQCRKLEADWDHIASRYQNQVNMAQVNCGDEKSQGLCTKLGVTTFPTMKFFKDGISRPCWGPFNVEDLTSFIDSANGPHLRQLNTTSLKALKHTEDSFFLFVYDSKVGLDDLNLIQPALAGQYFASDIYLIPQDLIKGHIPEVDAALPHLASVHSGKIRDVYKGTLDNVADVRKWLYNNQYSLVTNLDVGNFDLVLDYFNLTVMAIVDPAKDFMTLQKFRESAQLPDPKEDYRVGFTILDGVKWIDYVQRVYGKGVDDLPFVAIANPKKNLFYQSLLNSNQPLSFDPKLLPTQIELAKLGQLQATSSLDESRSHLSAGASTWFILLVFGLIGVALYYVHRRRANDPTVPSAERRKMLAEE